MARKIVPIFGTYTAPGGKVFELFSRDDVDALFQSLLVHYPKRAVGRDSGHPRLRAMPSRKAVKIG